MAPDIVDDLLEQTFGVPLLGYLLGLEPEAITSRLEGQSELSKPAEEVLGHLAHIAHSVTADGPGGFHRDIMLVDLLSRVHAEHGTSFGNMLRRTAGGAVASVVASDTVTAGLHSIALDHYPALLVPTDSLWHMSLHSHGHPVRVDLDEAILADADLRSLFPDEDPGLGGLARRGMVYTSLGTGGSIQSATFPDTAIQAAWNSARMESPLPTPEDLLRHISRVVGVFRRVAKGETVDVPCVIAFTGFRLAEDQAVTTPWGVLREPTAAERALAPQWIKGEVRGTDETGQQVSVSYGGDVLLSTSMPLRVKVTGVPVSVGGSLEWPAGLLNEAFVERTDCIQLAALLSVERPAGSWVTARPSWWMIANPFNPAPHIGGPMSVASQPGFTPYELSGDDNREMEFWTSRIRDHRTGSIDVSIRRLLSAASARADPTDRLVDAVIVWENLFGTSQGEVALRLSASLACLFETEQAARQVLQSRLAKLYAHRSKIVHGENVSSAELPIWANEATTYARLALAILLRDRPDLLTMKSSQRSLRLILGG